MLNQTYNFYFDPMKDGYSTTQWGVVTGTPAIDTIYLKLQTAGAIYKKDLIRGNLFLNLKMPAPSAGEDKKFGFASYNKGAHLYFQFTGAVLTAECSDGVTSKSVVIPWDATWTNAETVFQIKWESGMATFLVNGQFKAVFNDTYILDIPDQIVPGCPMSVYIAAGATSATYIKYFEVLGSDSVSL